MSEGKRIVGVGSLHLSLKSSHVRLPFDARHCTRRFAETWNFEGLEATSSVGKASDTSPTLFGPCPADSCWSSPLLALLRRYLSRSGLRLAGVRTGEEANEVLGRLLPAHNRRFSKKARQQGDAHRPLGPGHDLAAILSIQEERVVANDYTIRFRNRFYQLLKPVYPGERGGKVVIELRLDGSMAIRLGKHDLKYQEVPAGGDAPGALPPDPRRLAHGRPTPAGEKTGQAPGEGARPTGVQPAGGRSGRTAAEPYPPDGAGQDSGQAQRRPAEDHPWRKPFQRQK
jgi:hypothetical protein